MKGLTDHKRRILAVLDALGAGRLEAISLHGNDGAGFFLRYEIRQIIDAPVARRDMAVLRSAGLVEAESELVLHLVDSEVCTCGCDRYRCTPKGSAAVAEWNVKLPPQFFPMKGARP